MALGAGFASDDDTGRVLSRHSLCRMHGISISHTVISSAARNLPCTLLFLAPFAERFSPFPLSHMERYTSMQERSLGSAFDDIAGKTLTQHVLSLSPRNTIPFLLVYLFPHAYNKMRETLIQSRNLISHVFSTI